jgi:hypothetical protein
MLRGFDIEVITEHTLFFVSGSKDQRGNLRILATDEYINIGLLFALFYYGNAQVLIFVWEG